ncbi:MAG: extracellular solute-binding protein [Caldilineaceae bacterium]
MMTTRNKLSRRRFLQGLAMSAGATTLAACVTPVATPATGAAGGAPAAESASLTFMNWDEVQGSPFAIVLDAFTDATGIQVEIQPTPSQDYGTKLRTALSAGTAADVFRVDDDDVRGLALEGVFSIYSPLSRRPVLN